MLLVESLIDLSLDQDVLESLWCEFRCALVQNHLFVIFVVKCYDDILVAKVGELHSFLDDPLLSLAEGDILDMFVLYGVVGNNLAFSHCMNLCLCLNEFW